MRAGDIIRSFLTHRVAKRARTQTVLQLEATECGAASLAMVLGHFGRHIPLDELRSLCGVSRDGAKASSLLRAARQFGMECKGVKAEPDELQNLPVPMLAFINFNHFLVIEGVSNGIVYINDPSSGHRRETLESFAIGFTGVALTFERGANFESGDERPSLALSLLQRIQGFHAPLGFALLISIALLVPGLLLPFLNQVFVDYVLIRSISAWLGPLLITMTGLALLIAGLGIVRSFSLIDLTEAMQMRTATSLMRHMTRLPISFFEQRHTGEVVDRLRLNESLVNLLGNEVTQMLLNLLLAGFFLAVMFAINTKLTVLVLVLAALNIAVLLASAPFFSERFRKRSIDEGKLSGAVVSGLKDIETYKASGAENLLFTRWSGLHTNVINGDQRIAELASVTQPLPPLLLSLMGLTTLLGGAYAVMEGQMSLGELVAFQALALGFSAPVVALARFGAELQEIRSYTARLDDTLGQTQAATFLTGSQPEFDGLPKGQLTLERVSFSYAPFDPPVIENLHLDVLPGRRIALVGASGSGKSTVGKLVGGLVEPGAGRVLIDGQPTAAWQREVLASRLAYVQQDVVLFAGSIRDNIRLWDSRISDAAIIDAAADAGIHSMITSRPGGYSAEVVENASNFSGGEKQRIEIARALATDPSIIILDEATSALDTITELRVMEAIRRRGITCVVIAHRLSAIRDSDEILVLHHGQVIERGTHTALMHSNGRYAELLDA